MSAPFADNLRRWNRECSGWEPSMSLLQKGADDAADLIDALYDALDEALDALVMAAGENVGTEEQLEAHHRLVRAEAALAKARGEQQ